ncbi:general transcription factor IIH subunit 4 [Anomalospiza imberbis]|uniref:general transcription factor IIH subunit 4 n=1 Tax=Anomalospiza imberbis TaxID=187417 RepID=UPI00358FD127
MAGAVLGLLLLLLPPALGQPPLGAPPRPRSPPRAVTPRWPRSRGAGGSCGGGGEVLLYRCPPGSAPSPTALRRCGPDGAWDPLPGGAAGPPRCQAVWCPGPLEFEHGWFYPRGGRHPPGSVLRYGCAGGFALRGPPERRCGAGGAGRGPDPVCDDGSGDCPAPAVPPGASMEGSRARFAVEGLVRFRCRPGLQLVGSAERRCLEGGGVERHRAPVPRPQLLRHPRGRGRGVPGVPDPDRGGGRGQQHPRWGSRGDPTAKRRIRLEAGGALNVFLVLDASRSVNAQDYENARTALGELVEKIASYGAAPRYGVVTFGSEPRVVLSPTEPNATDGAAVRERLRGLRLDAHSQAPGTNLAGALRAVYALLVQQERAEQLRGAAAPPGHQQHPPRHRHHDRRPCQHGGVPGARPAPDPGAAEHRERPPGPPRGVPGRLRLRAGAGRARRDPERAGVAQGGGAARVLPAGHRGPAGGVPPHDRRELHAGAVRRQPRVRPRRGAREEPLGGDGDRDGEGKAWSDDTAPLGPGRHARDVPALDKYAEERWEFLLLDTPAQLWFFILQYLRGAEDYSVEGMSESLLTFLQHLREFGLVFQRKRKSRRFYPTRLAIALASGTAGTSLGTEPDGHGFVLVETNYRIYAYTDSELQVALIALFSELLYRFPNLVVAQVTRDSVQAAIANGITAEQIIHFLRTRAHPVMAKQSPVLPPTVTDQIRLWELERDRLRFSDGVLYNQFLSQVDFEVLRDHARALGVLVFENPARRLMVVTPAGHPDVKRFWKRQKHNG